jgi:proline iminopeptidase
MITLKNGYRLWVSKFGDGKEKILVLHGGPGSDHSYLLDIKDHLDLGRFEVIFYDQLGCGKSDKPADNSLWTLDRYIEEVEEVRQSLNLSSFILYGHSWGALLAIEYALKYPLYLKGLVISNMTASIKSYEYYINTLRSKLPEEIQEKLKNFESQKNFKDPQYLELLFSYLYSKHLCRFPQWPNTLIECFEKLNKDIYNTMQGPNEFVITGNLKSWDRWKDLKNIKCPCLVIGGKYDEMNLSDLALMTQLIPNSDLNICDHGSHLAFLDDPQSYYKALNSFLNKLYS